MTATTPRTLTVELPLPPAKLNPNNSRGGFVQLSNGRRLYPKSQAAAEYRELCGWSLYIRKRKEWDHVAFYFARLSFRFLWCTGRRAWDADNALSAMKPAIDCLRDVGVLRDDGAKRVTYGAVESLHCPRRCRCGGRVEVTVEEVTP